MNNKILCPWCMTIEIDQNEGICEKCYINEDETEQDHWSNFKKHNIAMLMGVACKIDEEFQYLENIPNNNKQLEIFHKRRILCCLEFLNYVDNKLFTPATQKELDDYKQIIANYTLGKTEYKSADKLAKELNIKKDVDLYSLHSLFFNFWRGEDILDWCYSQYFEITASDLESYISQNVLIDIMKKHFNDILSQPVKRIIKK